MNCLKYRFEIVYLEIHGVRAIATATRDHLALLGRGTNAATAAAERRRAALGLALVVLEDEKVVLSHFHFGAQQRLIRRRAAPVAQAVRGPLHDIVVRADRLVAVALRSAAQHIISKTLRTRIVGKSTEHQIIGRDQESQHDEDKSYACRKHLSTHGGGKNYRDARLSNTQS